MTQPHVILDRLVGRAGQLYSLPAVAMKVLELAANPQLDTHALRDCIENDPALATRILRVVNSSLFGLSRQVSDLNQALTLLGTKPLKLLVLGFSLPDGLYSGVAADVLGQYWRHTLTKAVAAREISETLWRQPGDDAFLAGLLQDIGMLLLIQVLGEPYQQFLRRAQASGRDLVELETETMGFDHTALSARILAHWRLPDALARNVSWKDLREAAAAPTRGESPLPHVLRLAELTARLLADGRPEVLGELLAAGAECRGLTQAQLEALVAELEHKVAQLADVLRLELPKGRDYRDVLVEAHLRLAEVAAEAAGELLARSRSSREPSAESQGLAHDMHALSEAVAHFARRPGPRPVASGPPAPQCGPVAPAATGPRSAPAMAAAGPTSVPTAAPRKTARVALAQLSGAEPDPGLLGRLAATVGACRQARCPLSLLLAEPECPDEVLLSRGVDGAEDLRRLLQDACLGLDQDDLVCLPHGEWGFAVVLPGCDRQRAVRLGNQLIERMRRVPPRWTLAGRRGVALGVGAASVAMPPKNFPAHELLDAAARCLYGSHASGGGVVKSIEIY